MCMHNLIYLKLDSIIQTLYVHTNKQSYRPCHLESCSHSLTHLSSYRFYFKGSILAHLKVHVHQTWRSLSLLRRIVPHTIYILRFQGGQCSKSLSFLTTFLIFHLRIFLLIWHRPYLGTTRRSAWEIGTHQSTNQVTAKSDFSALEGWISAWISAKFGTGFLNGIQNIRVKRSNVMVTRQFHSACFCLFSSPFCLVLWNKMWSSLIIGVEGQGQLPFLNFNTF